MGNINAKKNSSATSHRGKTEEKGSDHYPKGFVRLTDEVKPY